MQKMEEVNVHTILDLEACYDRQLPELCSLVEESVGANRKVVKLVTKVLPRVEHHVGTVNGVSKEKYGGEKYLLGGTGQGNVFSGVTWRDLSCVIFKQLENKQLGIRIEPKCNGKIEQRVVIPCVDDADFCTSGANNERKNQEIASCHVKMYEATGGKARKEKVFVNCWK